MTRTRMIGWTAMAICVLGYGGFAAVLAAAKFDYIAMTPALVLGGAAALVGEIGLWVAAGCLGLTLFKRRQALFDRLMRCGRTPTSPV